MLIFFRGRPEKAAAAEEEVLERVRAMKREFQEYREQQQQQQHEKSTTSTSGQQQGEEESATQTATADASKKLESLI